MSEEVWRNGFGAVLFLLCLVIIGLILKAAYDWVIIPHGEFLGKMLLGFALFLTAVYTLGWIITYGPRHIKGWLSSD